MKYLPFRHYWCFPSLVVCLLVLTSANNPRGPEVSVQGALIQEFAPYNLLFTEPVARFQGLLNLYAAAGRDTNQIAGFTFVPERRYFTASELAAASNLPTGANGPTGPLGPAANMPDLPSGVTPGPGNGNGNGGPGVYQTIGFRVFLTYWVEEAGNQEKRGIRFFGLANPESAFSLGPLPGSSQYFVLQNSEPDEYDLVKDREELEQIAEFELSFLPYDEYQYLAEGSSFYPPEQLAEISNASRGLIIERAAVSQSFSLVDGNVDRLYQYRTLSFRPSPQPDWGNNEESSIAFSYGYYCPPYWQRDDDDEETLLQELLDGGALFFQQPTPLIDEKHSEALLSSLGLIVERHLEKSNKTVNVFGPKKPEGLPDWLYWVGVGLLLGLGYLIGYLTGPSKPVN